MTSPSSHDASTVLTVREGSFHLHIAVFSTQLRFCSLRGHCLSFSTVLINAVKVSRWNTRAASQFLLQMRLKWPVRSVNSEASVYLYVSLSLSIPRLSLNSLRVLPPPHWEVLTTTQLAFIALFL